MPEERSDQIRQLLDSAQGAQSQPFHFVLGLDELSCPPFFVFQGPKVSIET